MKTATFIDPTTAEILASTAIVLAGMGVVIAIGVWVLNAMMDDAEEMPEPAGQGNTPKAPPEPGH